LAVRDPTDLTSLAAIDLADTAMCARARTRYSGPRRNSFRRRRSRKAALPNLIVIGGLKCGTSSLHHYLGLHPEIQMSKPKELNFAIDEINWDLGVDWYASRFDRGFPVRGETSPHYTNLPRFSDVAARLAGVCPDAKLIYMVRDPIDRVLSHWVHSTGAGYERGDLVRTLSRPDTAYRYRSRYWMQLQPFLDCFDSRQMAIFTREELRDDRAEMMKKVFGFLGVQESFSSPKFAREWERSSAKQGRKYQTLEGAIRLPGLRWIDGHFELLPDPARWVIERVMHEPGRPAQPKPALPSDLIDDLRADFSGDVVALRRFAGREFPGWRSYA
jgi:hypothetical protein